MRPAVSRALRLLPPLALLVASCAESPEPLPQPSLDGGGVRLDASLGGADGAVSQPDGASSHPELDACNQVDLAFSARTPSVLVLVDRSGSMWDMGLWDPLKAGVLEVIERLHQDVRFGFTTYSGRQGATCPELSAFTPLATGNAGAIRRAYDAIQRPTDKTETPTAAALTQAAAQLAGQSGARYVLLVTDGEPDFCDDGNVGCARDAVVAAAQAAHAQGIGTFIVSVGGQVDRAHLGDVANAGSGQPVQERTDCSSRSARYAATGGSARFFEPDVRDREALVQALSSVIAGVRSCTFNLAGKLEIAPGAAGQGVVEIDGERIPFDPNDGYRMNSASELELRGRACEKLRSPASQRVFIDFPCEAIVVL